MSNNQEQGFRIGIEQGLHCCSLTSVLYVSNPMQTQLKLVQVLAIACSMIALLYLSAPDHY